MEDHQYPIFTDPKKEMTKDIGKFRKIFRMFSDHFLKKYTGMSRWTTIVVMMGILYAISPIDMIPDIPFIGYIDDVVVLGFVWRHLTKEVKKYEAFLSTQG
jgi:uncharacterized membrane protein YkvA (DUF1232 family)